VAWTGDIVQLQASNPALGYALPQKGFTLWSDNFVVPNLAKHKKNAERLINYYFDPKVMAEVVAYVNYVSVVKGAKEIVVAADPGVGENPLIFPSAEVLTRAHVFRGLTADEETRYNRKFQSLVTG
jgi:spermidine/putrescine transport system substrate-binding protein